ncbi:hypothetical protein K6025_05300 [Ehrlichia sp. JZT12]
MDTSNYICNRTLYTNLDFNNDGIHGLFCIKHKDHIGCITDTVSEIPVESMTYQDLGSIITHWMEYLSDNLRGCITHNTSYVELCDKDFNYTEFVRGIVISCCVLTTLCTFKFLIKKFMLSSALETGTTTDIKNNTSFIGNIYTSRTQEEDRLKILSEEELEESEHVYGNPSTSIDVNMCEPRSNLMHSNP